MSWKRQSPAEIDGLFAAQRGVDPFGTRVHLVFGMVACFFAAWPTTYVDWAAACLMVCFAVRMISHHRVLGPLWWDPVVRLVVVWAAWVGLSRLWSAGTWSDWVGDAGSLRYALVIACLYPVMDRRRSLIAALVAGVVCGELSQFAHAMTVWMGRPEMLFHRDPARLSGWWDPVVGGSVLCAALGMVCGLALERTTGVIRRAAIVLVPVTVVCIAATGTRGAWIAGAGVLGVAGIVAARSAVRGKVSARAVGVVVLIAVVLGAGVLIAPSVRGRFERGWREVAGAVERGDYTTDTGMRIGMWVWAGRCVAHSPVVGVGAGGYQPWCAKRLAEGAEGREKTLVPLPHAHAHGWFVHTAATLGLVGLAILVALLGVALWPGCAGDRPRMYGAVAVRLGLVGLVLAGLFDTIHVNQQTANVWYILLALSVRMGPREKSAVGDEGGELQNDQI